MCFVDLNRGSLLCPYQARGKGQLISEAKFLFEPKTELKHFCNSALALLNGSNQKTNFHIRW